MTIDVYTSDTCAYCTQVKKYLTMKGKAYNEINVDQYPEREQEMWALTGQRIFPTIVVDDGLMKQVVGGYNLSLLTKLI